jgi:hypothetical protein
MLRIGRHLGSGRTSRLPILIGLVALAMLATASSALGAVVLRPQSDVRHDWQKVGATTASAALDDEVSAVKTAPKGDYIAARPDSRVADVRLAPQELKHGKDVKVARLWFAAKTARSGRLTVEVSARGELLGGRTLGAGRRSKWRSFQFKVPNGIALTALHARFESEAESRSQVRAAYARIRFTDADDANEGRDDEGGAGPSGPVSVYGPSETLRPDAKRPAGGTTDARLAAAQNEFESFQVNVQAGPEGLSGVGVSLTGDLTGPDGATISTDDVEIYREAYYTVDAAAGKPRSSGLGAEGRWPDALIPERDSFYHEDRSAFPYDVAANDELTAWVDVFVPAGAAPGTYTGSVEVTTSSGTIATIPVSVAVFALEMPSTSSLPSLFLMTPPGQQPCGAHTGEEWCGPNESHAWDLTYLYARAGLQNKMTIANPIPGAYEDAPSDENFTEYVQPLIDGSDPGLAGTVPPLMSGAQMTTVTAMWPCINDNDCLAEWRNLADEHGFADRFYAYACDEPSLTPSSAYTWDDWGDCARNSRQARRTWPDVNTLVTDTATDAQQAQSAGKTLLDQDVDVLVPNVTELAGTRPSYNSFLAGGGGSGTKQAWVYTSCSSYSCNEDENPESQDYPGYAIDQPASQARAIGWLAFVYGLQGELYWDTVNSLGTAWSNQYDFGANGDGNLFYPGSAHGTDDAPAIGGEHDIPIESMRLKRIRDGRDDYELLRALTAQGRGAEAMQVAKTAFGGQATAAHNTNLPASTVDGARCSLVGLIDQSAASYCS